MINPKHATIDEYTIFKMTDNGSDTPYMLGEEGDESVQEFTLFELVCRAYDYTQRRGLPYSDVTLHDLQNTWKALGNKSPEELVVWVEAVLDVTLEVFDN